MLLSPPNYHQSPPNPKVTLVLNLPEQFELEKRKFPWAIILNEFAADIESQIFDAVPVERFRFDSRAEKSLLSEDRSIFLIRRYDTEILGKINLEENIVTLRIKSQFGFAVVENILIEIGLLKPEQQWKPSTKSELIGLNQNKSGQCMAKVIETTNPLWWETRTFIHFTDDEKGFTNLIAHLKTEVKLTELPYLTLKENEENDINRAIRYWRENGKGQELDEISTGLCKVINNLFNNISI